MHAVCLRAPCHVLDANELGQGGNVQPSGYKAMRPSSQGHLSHHMVLRQQGHGKEPPLGRLVALPPHLATSLAHMVSQFITRPATAVLVQTTTAPHSLIRQD